MIGKKRNIRREGTKFKKIEKLKIRENNSNSPRGGISDFDDGEFYGFFSDFEQRKAKIQEELRYEIGSKEYAISTFGEDTEEYMGAKSNLDEKKEELSNQIELSGGFGELRTISDDSEADKMWKDTRELIRRESVESQLAAIQESENEFGAAMSENGGDQSPLPEQQATNIENEMLWNVEMGGGEIIIGDIVGVVGDARLEFREEQVQCLRKKGNAEEQQVLSALAILEEVISDQCQLELKANQDVDLITESAV